MLEMSDKWYPPCPPGRGAHGRVENAASIAFYASRAVTVRAAPSSQPPACRQHTFHAVTFVPSRCRPPDLFLHVPERHRSAAEAKNHGLKIRSQSMILSSSPPAPARSWIRAAVTWYCSSSARSGLVQGACMHFVRGERVPGRRRQRWGRRAPERRPRGATASQQAGAGWRGASTYVPKKRPHAVFTA